MDINRQTYEEYFLLYTDGELSSDERSAVETFVEENPDLRHEFVLMQQTVFTPDENEIFENKESLYRHEERRVIPFPWFRFAAAAILLITFSLIGWLFISNRNVTNPNEVIASKEPVTKEVETLQNVEPVTPQKAVSEETARDIADVTGKKEIKPVRINAVQRTSNKQSSSNIEPAITKPIENADPASIPEEIVETDLPKEEIDVAVKPRTITDEIEPEIHTAKNEQIAYAPENNDNMIYFANTSLPKKSKLRGVFRKASRILDKVTSFQ
jgi:hypothetical protein